MSINFDIDKNEDDLITDDDSEEEQSQSKKDNDLKKTLFKFAILIGGGLLIILLILFISSLFGSNNKNYTYEEIEQILKDAAVEYFKDYPDNLPQKENQIARIEEATLVMTNKMKNLSEYTGKGKNCTGVVEVQKKGKEYIYTPYLNCGEDYSSTDLSSELIKSTVSSGYGLYKINNEYVYRGEKVNNYVQLDNSLWRIVKITSENSIVLINEKGYSTNAPWDDRYNENAKFNAGINNYSTSRLREKIEEIYNDSSTDKALLSTNDKSKLVSFSVCIGKRTTNETKNDGSIECAKKISNQNMGVLTAADYINASIDSNCTSIDSKSCQNYNYLNNNTKWWLITSKANTSYTAYIVDSNGTIKEQSTSNYAYIRPVVYLNSNVVASNGDGTKENPYILK